MPILLNNANPATTFIGPKSETIRKMGDKAKARETMEKAKVPIIPVVMERLVMKLGFKSLKIGFPVIIKAVSGGGGFERIAHNAVSFTKEFQSARPKQKKPLEMAHFM